MSGESMKVSLVLQLIDRFSDRSRRITDSFTRMGQRGQQAMRMITAASIQASNALDRLGNRYTAIATGAIGTGAVRGVVELQRRLIMLGITANSTSKEIEQLKNQLFEIANNKDIMIDPSQILDAMDVIIEKTGDLKLAQENMRNIGLGIRATGAQGEDIGGLVSDLSQKFNIGNSKDMLNMLDLLTNQGKAGAFTMKDLATQGNRVTAAYAATGRTGMQAVREMGAMLQMVRQGVGGPEQTSTAFEALLRTLENGQKRKLLTASGIRIVDPKDPGRMRDISAIVKDLIVKTKGDVSKLSSVFDEEGMRALNPFAIEYKRTGRFDSYDQFYNQAATGAQIMKDAATATEGFDAALQKLHTAADKYVFNGLSGPLKDIGVAIKNMDEKKLERIIGLLANGALILGGGIVLNKAVRAGIGIAGWAKKLGGAAAEGAAGKLTPQPVIVLNWPYSLGSAPAMSLGSAGAAGAVGSAAGRAGLMRGGIGLLGRAAIPLAVTANAGALFYAKSRGDRQGELAAAGRFSGAFGGAAAGALIGSVVPVIGTGLGAAVGGITGSIGMGVIGSHVGATADARAAAAAAAARQAVDVGGTLKIEIDNKGNGAVVSSRPNDPRVNYQARTGLLMGGP